MTVIWFKNVTFHIDGIMVTKNINFKLTGLCNLVSEASERGMTFFKVLFKHRLTRLEEGFLINGEIFVDQQYIPVDKFFLLLTKYRLFDGNENVREALTMVDADRVDRVIKDFEINFEGSKLSTLNIEEARIFEILLNMVEMPPLVFLHSIELRQKVKKKYLATIERYINESGSICLVSSAFEPEFGSTVISRGDIIFSLNKDAFAKYRIDKFLERIEVFTNNNGDYEFGSTESVDDDDYKEVFPSTRDIMEITDQDLGNNTLLSTGLNNEENTGVNYQGKTDRETDLGIFTKSNTKANFTKLNTKTNCISTKDDLIKLGTDKAVDDKKSVHPYDYKKHLKKYKCDKLFELKGKCSLRFTSQLFNLDIYKVNLKQARALAFRKYYLMVSKYNERTNIYKNIGPFIVFILCLRIYQQIDQEMIWGNIPLLFCLLLFLYLEFYKFKVLVAVIVFFKYVLKDISIQRIFSLVHDIFRHVYTHNELKITTGFLHLCIFYSNSTIFVEDRPFLDYYTNILMTPGTYVISVFMYLIFTQFIAFVIIGLMFNIDCILITTINALVVNMLIACATTKRLRETFISIFITLYVFLPKVIFSYIHGLCKNILFHVFSVIFTVEMHYASIGLLYKLGCVLPFYLIVYVVCCSRVGIFSI